MEAFLLYNSPKISVGCVCEVNIDLGRMRAYTIDFFTVNITSKITLFHFFFQFSTLFKLFINEITIFNGIECKDVARKKPN